MFISGQSDIITLIPKREILSAGTTCGCLDHLFPLQRGTKLTSLLVAELRCPDHIGLLCLLSVPSFKMYIVDRYTSYVVLVGGLKI